MREPESHPSPERIATLLDPTGPLTDEAELRAHLACCRRCFGLYLEMAENQLTWRHSGEAEAVPEDLLHTARALAEEPAPPAVPVLVPVARPSRRAGRWLAIAAVLVAASLLWLVLPHPMRENEELALVRLTVSQASLSSDMVLTDAILPPPDGVMRSGSQWSPALERSLDTLARDYEAQGGEDLAYWYSAGMLASRSPDARKVVEDAAEQYTSSVRIANLAVVAIYQAGDLENAKQRLNGILQHHPHDRVALFNRAVILKEKGLSAEYDQARKDLLAALDHDSELWRRAQDRLPPRTGTSTAESGTP